MGMGSLSSIRSSAGGSPEPSFKKGRWVPFSRPGVKRILTLDVKGWRIEISERTFGITLRRTTFSAAMTGPHPPFRHSVSGLSTREAATAAASRWIDHWHETNGHLLQAETVHKLRRREMAKKLFKIRSISRRSKR